MTDHQLLVLARCAGFVFRAPGFSHPAVPPPVRAGLAFALALVLGRSGAGAIAPAPFVAALVGEVVLGFALGMAAAAIYDAAFAGGRTLDDYSGIRGSVPTAGITAGAGFGRLWELAFTAGFFVLGGYRLAIAAFAATFTTIPVGALSGTGGFAALAVATVGVLLRTALLIAAPAIAAAFVAQFALAATGRIIPRFSSFTLSFPVVFGVVLMTTLALVPVLLPQAASPWFAVPRAIGR
ncbi:MAG: flagellar biosynthetic protein FliR [Vulcanimicrobiaceae bacterium]